MWGSETWGEIVWQGAGAAIPLLGPVGVAVLAGVLLIAAVSIARRAYAQR